MTACCSSRGVEREQKNCLIFWRSTARHLGSGSIGRNLLYFFTQGCPQATRDTVKGILHVDNESLNERYLGMPTDVGNSFNGTFKFLRDRMWSKIKGWLEKILSAGGKEVLIKSIAQAIPVYSMACFRLPWGLCNHINSLVRQFWWGSKQGQRKVSWVSWEVMTRPKHLGGLGFRDIEIFNLCLLARQS